MVVRFQKICAVDHPIFSTRFLRNGSFIPEHAGRQKDILCVRKTKVQLCGYTGLPELSLFAYKFPFQMS